MALPLLQVEVTPLDATSVVDIILDPDCGGTLANHNLHSVFLYHTDPDYRQFVDGASWVLIDGWPVWLEYAIRAGRSRSKSVRIGSTEWLEELLSRNPALRVVAVGGTAQTAAGAAAAFAARADRMEWYAYDGYAFLPASPLAERTTLTDALQSADLVVAAMGMPRQEQWLAARHSEIARTAVVANVGGALDYYAGTQRLAPRWLGPLGLEWLYRLVASPRRLASRYLVEPFLLAGVLARRRFATGDRRPTEP